MFVRSLAKMSAKETSEALVTKRHSFAAVWIIIIFNYIEDYIESKFLGSKNV